MQQILCPHSYTETCPSCMEGSNIYEHTLRILIQLHIHELSNFCLIHIRFLSDLLLNLIDVREIFFRNVGWFSTGYTTLKYQKKIHSTCYLARSEDGDHLSVHLGLTVAQTFSDFPPRRPRFEPGSSHSGSVLDRAVETDFLRVLRVPLPLNHSSNSFTIISIYHPVLVLKVK
jgi:hypothetical protein